MYTLGIDIGSTTSKCVILQDGASITARSLQLGGLGTDGPEDALTELVAGERSDPCRHGPRHRHRLWPQ